ncbi:MAG: CDP-alcohol phosphatidyltransferase family protein [Candidatus Hodarchaeota archaeon]
MTNRNFTLSEIRSFYSHKKQDLEKNNLWGYYILRKASFPVTWVFLKLNFSANKVTYLSFIFGISGALIISFGIYFPSLIGALLINLWALLDYVDGNIARCTNSSTKHGEFLDSIGGGIIGIFMFICVGIGINNNVNDHFYQLVQFEVAKYIFIILGILTALFLIFIEWIGSIYGQIYHTTKKQFFGSSYPLVFKIFFNLVNISGVLMPLLFFFAIINLLSFFLFFFSFIYGVNSVGVLIFLYSNSRSD